MRLSASVVPPVVSDPSDDLKVNDLVIWVGQVHEHSSLNRRIIYRVVHRRVPTPTNGFFEYRLRPAYDLENPIGSSQETSPFTGARDLRRVTLLDLCIMRLMFDSFIKEYARSQGYEPDTVST